MKASHLAAVAALALGAGSAAKAEDLTLCWAAWDPANALVELSKDFEAQSGHKMTFEFVPWTNYADRMLNELNSGGKLCDLMIGDSQWIGAGAESGHQNGRRPDRDLRPAGRSGRAPRGDGRPRERRSGGSAFRCECGRARGR